MLIKLLKCLDLGMERNTLCFDEFAKQGEFTRRLIVLMKYISIENGSTSPLSEIYISRMAFRQIFCWPSNSHTDAIVLDTDPNIHDESQYAIHIMGIHIIISNDLGLVWENDKSGFGVKETNSNIMHVFTESGACVEYNDRELVIGMSDDRTNVMLGGF